MSVQACNFSTHTIFPFILSYSFSPIFSISFSDSIFFVTRSSLFLSLTLPLFYIVPLSFYLKNPLFLKITQLLFEFALTANSMYNFRVNLPCLLYGSTGVKDNSFSWKGTIIPNSRACYINHTFVFQSSWPTAITIFNFVTSYTEMTRLDREQFASFICKHIFFFYWKSQS